MLEECLATLCKSAVARKFAAIYGLADVVGFVAHDERLVKGYHV